MNRLSMRVAFAFLAFFLAATASLAHEGHEHGAPPPAVSASIAPRFEAASDALEMVGVYRAGKLTLHLDRFRGNVPETDAGVELETPKGNFKAQPLGDGRYVIEAPGFKPGRTDLIATITAGADVEVLTASLIVPEDGLSPATGSADLAQRLPDGALFVPKATQKILGLRNALAEAGAHRRAVALPARIIPDPETSAVVQASVAGRLMPPPGGFPRLGSAVKAGQVLALVMPAIPAADLTAQAQQARELDQLLALAQRKLERYRLAPSAFPRAQMEDAEVEVAGLERRRAALEVAPRAPEKLIAPVEGVIAASSAVIGQVADANAVIFQIIDPGRFWVEALSYGTPLPPDSASLALPGGQAAPLAFVGAGLADRQQAVPAHFAVAEPVSGLRAGQLVTVLAKVGETRPGIALPRSAVVRAPNGLSIVFEQAGAERFVPHVVSAEPLDGTRMTVRNGIEPGRRIVTEGAELLNQFR